MRLPIGIQDFAKLRGDGYAYVDKTEHIYRCIRQAPYLFYSRPRRFGKSLTVATLNELYRRRRELFEGLWIEDHWDWDAPPNPVIWLKTASVNYQGKPLGEALSEMLAKIGADYGLTLASSNDAKSTFTELIQQLHHRFGRVVLLIDEYDKPLIDYLDNLDQLERNREVLKGFYSVIKDSDPYLEQVFITGVSAFSKVSLFSDLNNLFVLTLDYTAYHLSGITEREIDQYFSSWMEGVDREKMRSWYNGYSWGSEEKVYNPFSLITFLQGRQYRNYWFETGTPTFLVRYMKQNRLYDVGRSEATARGLTVFNPANLDPIATLFQTGYLTVVETDPDIGVYTLDYPNVEVRQAMQQHLLEVYLDHPTYTADVKAFSIVKHLRQGDLESTFNVLNAIFASMPYDFWRRDDEHIFHAVIHLTFMLVGVHVQSEVHSAGGRCDVLVQTDDNVYAIEFKRDQPVEVALQQIDDRGYLRPYADDPRSVFAVGVSFSTEQKAVVDWRAEPIKQHR